MSMPQQANQKVTASHLKKQAYCYVRQSTLKQVFENTESTKRQYALRERAIALGWPVVQIVTVDSDLGETATSVADRHGFQKLMTEVSMGRVGLVIRDIRTGLRLACKKAKIKYGRFVKGGFILHDLRHTFNTNMRKAGVAESVIMRVTGHSTREMFDRYNTIDESDTRQAVAQMVNFIESVDHPVDQGTKKAPTDTMKDPIRA
jgi:hypothetical protein